MPLSSATASCCLALAPPPVGYSTVFITGLKILSKLQTKHSKLGHPLVCNKKVS